MHTLEVSGSNFIFIGLVIQNKIINEKYETKINLLVIKLQIESKEGATIVARLFRKAKIWASPRLANICPVHMKRRPIVPSVTF